MRRLLLSPILFLGVGLYAQEPPQQPPKETLSLTRAEAEQDALKNSDQLKAIQATADSAKAQSKAAYGTLYPSLSFDARYSNLTHVPALDINGDHVLFGAHDNYLYGPAVKWTVWDSFGSYKAYKGASELARAREAQGQDQSIGVLLGTRRDYVRVQEAVEQLGAVSDSLALAKSQLDDIQTRRKAGAASKLDAVEAERQVLSYQIQFSQRQTELSSALKDLLARTRNRNPRDLSKPGPANVPGVTLEVRFEPLQKSLDEQKDFAPTAPSDGHPRIQAADMKSTSLKYQAQSASAGLWPSLDVKWWGTMAYPSGPQLEQVNQNITSLNATWALFDFNKTRSQVAEKRLAADAARYERDQAMIDLQRDYMKATQYLNSLREQQILAEQDVKNSAEAARLYYEQYKLGRAVIIDVETANNRALLSKVNKAHIDAEIVNALDDLKAISGKEIPGWR